MRDQFLQQIRCIVGYWSDADNLSSKERCEGTAFSILTLLDGGSGMPRMCIIPTPHPDDKQYHVDNNENYYPAISDEIIEVGIGGTLHEEFLTENERK